MANNIQINVWRGTNTPPTNYHLWIKNDEEILLFTNNKWTSISGGKELVEIINQILNNIKNLNTLTNTHTNLIADLTGLLTTQII